MGTQSQSSPYITCPTRLADVIAAIQVLGSYKFHMTRFERWSFRITGDDTKGDYWKRVFEEHPEFFRLDSSKELASLVLRRQQPKLDDVDAGAMITPAKYAILDTQAKARISRRPLESNQIEALVNVAISLHSRAAERERDRRWWLPLVFAFGGALVGGVIPAILKLISDSAGAF
jgi:hypothetical protein